MNYFAYGSNMDAARMRRLGLRFRARQAAGLEGWQLVFRKRASDAPSRAYATITRAAGARVEGVLYRLGGDLRALDAFEGVPRFYRRRTVRVHCAGRPLLAAVYVARPGVCARGLRVEDWYLAHLLAAGDLLSADYRRRLLAVPTVQSRPRW